MHACIHRCLEPQTDEHIPPEVKEGVILLQRYDRKSSCFQLRLCNKKLANLNFTVDISKSVNLDRASSGGLRP